MSQPLDLAAAGSPAATAALDQMLRALQDALRLAMAQRERAVEEAAFWEQLDRAFAAYDRFLAVVTTAHPMSCRMGCTACCHDNPQGVAGVEILRLKKRMNAGGLADGLRERIATASAGFQARQDLHGEAAASIQRARGEPCPLLGADGLCVAYAQRPVACRMFHATTPAAWCTPTDLHFADRVNPNLVPPLVCRQLLGAISRCLGLPASTDLWSGLAAEG